MNCVFSTSVGAFVYPDEMMMEENVCLYVSLPGGSLLLDSKLTVRSLLGMSFIQKMCFICRRGSCYLFDA